MAFEPTPEQHAIVDAFRKHDGDLTITAGAGAGKTSTLKLLAAAEPGARGVYLAYNKAIAAEAQAEFPGRVLCKTSHSLAFAAVGRAFVHRLNAPRIKGLEQARILGLRSPVRVSDEKVLGPTQLARITMQTIAKFCYSGDLLPNRFHVPRDYPGVAGIPEAQRVLDSVIVPAAVRAWNDDLTSVDGKLRFSHDIYLKMWSLSDPIIDADFVMLDEAQDTNGCVAAVFDKQTHAIRVAVGDPNQAIYGWRGATDYMSGMTAKYRLTLSQSFRFGQEIADEANKWLSVLDSDLRISGTGHSQIRSLEHEVPDAVLCRTNAEAVATLIKSHEAGIKAGLVGGGREILDFARAVEDLRDQHWTSHPELSAFQSYGEVQDYVENDHGGEDFKVMVKLIDTYGTHGIMAAIENSTDEKRADLIISTAHKSKGREWNRVRVADDFPEPKVDENGDPGAIAKPDAMLAYVTVTRAKKVLDRGSLGFVDAYLGGGRHVGQAFPGQPTAPAAEPARIITVVGIDPSPTEDPHAAFLYVVTADGRELIRTTNFLQARDIRDAHPGSTLDSKARQPLSA